MEIINVASLRGVQSESAASPSLTLSGKTGFNLIFFTGVPPSTGIFSEK